MLPSADPRPLAPLTRLAELKELLRLHIRTQHVQAERFQRVLETITQADGDGPGSWPGEWIQLGSQLLAEGRTLDAVQAFNFGRFPFIDGPARQRSLERCLRSFQAWMRDSALPIERRLIQCQGELVPIYTNGHWQAGGNVLIVMGGIVSVKEQWYSSLRDAPKSGFSVAVADFPGVGENPLVLDRHSDGYLGDVIDALARIAPDQRFYLVAISFAGYLALRQAAVDPRIRGVVLSGTPTSAFFRDARWWASVPETTKRILSHLTRVPQASLFECLQTFALDESELARVRVPVRLLTALRDEIIPRADSELLSNGLASISVRRFDDVHGAPSYLGAIRLDIVASLLRFSGRRRVLSWILMFVSILNAWFVRVARSWRAQTAVVSRALVVPIRGGRS